VNGISDVMVSVLTSSAVDHGFEPWFDQTKDYIIVICCFSAKHAALRRKSKDWLAQNHDNMLEFEHYKNPIKPVGQVQSRPHHHVIEN